MAALRSQRQALLTSSTSSQQQTSARDRPKLRNSCHVCASSKLKCSQDKPTCSRCAKRGLHCEYVAAKPGGRRPHKHSSNETHTHDVPNLAVNTNEDGDFSSQATWFTSPLSNPSIDPLGSPDIICHSSRPSISGSSDGLTELFGPTDQILSSTSTVADNDPDNLFNSPITFSTDMSDVNIFQPADFFPTSIEDKSNGPERLSAAYPRFENAMSGLLALSVPSSSSTFSSCPSREAHNYTGFRAAEPPCSCLVQALGFMTQLFPSPSSSDCMTRATQGLDQTTAIPTIQATIARNEATIEAVSAMLNCPSCSQNGYLLAVISLIIFRVLGWYAIIAHQTHSPHSGSPPGLTRPPSPPQLVLENPTVLGSYRLDGADSPRMAAQLVLNELHRVRRLVDQLSSKLKEQAQADKNGIGRGEPAADTPEGMVDSDYQMTLPLSPMMYDQLDVDLKKRLKALSCKMIDRLRTLWFVFVFHFCYWLGLVWIGLNVN